MIFHLQVTKKYKGLQQEIQMTSPGNTGGRNSFVKMQRDQALVKFADRGLDDLLEGRVVRTGHLGGIQIQMQIQKQKQIQLHLQAGQIHSCLLAVHGHSDAITTEYLGYRFLSEHVLEIWSDVTRKQTNIPGAVQSNTP